MQRLGGIDECSQFLDLGGDRGSDGLGIFCSARLTFFDWRGRMGFDVFVSLASFLFEIVLFQVVLDNELFD